MELILPGTGAFVNLGKTAPHTRAILTEDADFVNEEGKYGCHTQKNGI